MNNPIAEERLDYGDSGNGGSQKLQYQGSGTIPALADEELMGDDDEYEDLYNDVNIGEGMFQFNQAEAPVSSSGFQAQPSNLSEPGRGASGLKDPRSSGIDTDEKYLNPGVKFSEQKVDLVADKGPGSGAINHLDAASISEKPSLVNSGFQHQVSMVTNPAPSGTDQKVVTDGIGGSGALQAASVDHAGRIDVLSNRGVTNGNPASSKVDNGMTTLFVGELHWWTTDAELENVLAQYGNVTEIKFFDERASGKSKGYCQVEFSDSASATACKEGMDGYIFNGRACVVAFATAQTLKQIGAAYVTKNQSQPPQNQLQPLGRRNMNDGGSGRGGGTNFAAGDSGRNFGRGGRGGGRGSMNGGPVFGGPGGRGGPMVTKNPLTNLSAMGNGAVGNFGLGLHGPSFGGPANGMMHHPQAMMGPGFDPTFMGQGAGFGGFSGPSFPGMMPQFPGVNPMGLGVAPHVNPAFFNRGMTPHGMGAMGAMGGGGMDGLHGAMWGAGDPSTGGWGGQDYGRGQRMRESSYGTDDGASRYGYGEMNPEKGGRSNSHETERASQRPGGNSERTHRDETGQGSDRADRGHRYRDEKDEDRRSKERDTVYEDDGDRGVSSSRSRSRSRVVAEDDHRSRSRDTEHGKRRRFPE